MKRLKKAMSLSLAATLCVGLLAGCSSTPASESTSAAASGSESTEATSEAAAEQVELTVALVSDDVNVMQNYGVVEAFEAANPNIKVNVMEVSNNDYNDKMIVQLSGGQPIDVIFAGDNTAYANFISKNIIIPLDDYITADGIDVTPYGATWDSLLYEGKMYQMPVRNSEWVLYYNKDLFDAAGVEYPKDSMTYEEFRELAKQMTSGEGQDKIYGAYIHSWPISWYRVALQGGATILDEDLTPFKDAIQYRLDLEADGSIMPYTEQIATSANYRTAFLSGKVAMHLMGDFHIGQLRQAEENGELTFDWDIASSPIPEGAAPNTTTGMPAGLCITTNSEHPDEAWKFISFASGSEGAKAYAEAGYVPSYADDAVREVIAYDGTTKPANIGILLEQNVYPEYPVADRIGEVNTIFGEESSLTLSGDATPDEMIANIRSRVDELGLGE